MTYLSFSLGCKTCRTLKIVGYGSKTIKKFNLSNLRYSFTYSNKYAFGDHSMITQLVE